MRYVYVLLFMLPFAFGYKSYSGYQVFRTVTLDEEGVTKLIPLLERPELDFWLPPRINSFVDIMVPPEYATELWDELIRLGLQPSVLVNEVGILIEEEAMNIKRRKDMTKTGERAPNFDNYMTYEEIDAYLDEVAATYPNVATLIPIGASYEGRAMRVLKLSNGPGKSGIWFEAAIHAREWLAPPVVLYTINELTENLAVNQAMLDKNDFYLLPVANPDGYVYTWTDERFWRKNRSPNEGSTCIGTDLNRNYDWHWNESTEDVCANLYAGRAPFSEPETIAMSNFLLSESSVTFYCAVHTYGQYMLYPWAHTLDYPPTITELNRVGTEAANAIEAYNGTIYTVGTFGEVLYLATGTSQDWAHGVRNISLSYTIELPGGGFGGFNPPPSQISPTVSETWEAIKVFAANIP